MRVRRSVYQHQHGEKAAASAKNSGSNSIASAAYQWHQQRSVTIGVAAAAWRRCSAAYQQQKMARLHGVNISIEHINGMAATNAM